MRITRLTAGESIEDLVARAYAGLDTKTAIRQAATAVRAANPRLRRLAQVPDGARVVLPDLPGARPAGDARRAGAEGADALLRALRQESETAGQALLDAAAQAAELAEGQLELLDRIDLSGVLQFPEIAAAADAVREDAELARRELSLMADAVGGTRERIARDSERLAELLN